MSDRGLINFCERGEITFEWHLPLCSPLQVTVKTYLLFQEGKIVIVMLARSGIHLWKGWTS